MALPSDNNSPRDASVALGKNTNTGNDITITDDELVRHISVVGATGTHKSTLLQFLALQAVKNGKCLIYIDVDNRSIYDLLTRIPKERMKDVVLVDFSDRRRFIGINYVSSERDIERCIELLKRLWNITPETPNLENTLRASLLTLQFNNLTLDRMPDLLRDKAFRASCMARIPHTLDALFVREFWEKDFNQHDVQYQIRNSDSTLNKIMQMFMDKYIAYIIAQTSNTLHIKEDILDKDNKKILLINLSKNDLKKERVRRIGAIILEELQHALFTRADLHIVTLICDEWQMYLTPDFFEDVLSQGRRYGIAAVLATQTLEYFDNKLQAILDQVGTHITFAVGVKDAYKLAPFYAKDPPPELKYEQIYEPEIIKSTKEVVTWEPPEAEQTYNQVEEEQAELQAEFRDFELIKALGLALLHLVFGQKGTNKNLSSLKEVHILCNPDFQDIAIATSQKIIPAGSAAIERHTRLPELYKKRSELEEAKRRLERKRLGLEDVPDPFLILWFFDFLWKPPFQKARDRENDKLLQAVRECEDEILAELEADRRYDNGYQYIIPATTLTPIEKNIDFLLHADDDFFAQLKGSFFPPHTITVVKEKGGKEERENFFDRYIAFLPSMLQLFTHPLPEMEVITATSLRNIPLTEREKTEITKYVRYLKLQIDMLLDRRDEAFVFIPQKGFHIIINEDHTVGLAKHAIIYNHPQLEDGTRYFYYGIFKYPNDTISSSDNASDVWREICAQGSRFHQQRESLDQERYLYLKNHYGYWHMQEHPEMLAFFDAEIHRFSDMIFPKLDELELLKQRHDELLRCKKITTEEVIEYKALTLNTGEVIPQYFTQKHEKEIKVSIGFSEGESMGRGRSESHGKSISFSEDKINLFRNKDGTTRTYTDMEKEKAKELLHLPDGIAFVAMRMRGDRFTPRMKTYALDEMHPRQGSLEKRHLQALENAIPYTTDAGTIDQEFWKRRQGFKIAPSPVMQTPQEEKEHDIPVLLHIVKRRVSTANVEEFLPALSFGDNYLKLFYHFHFLTRKQVCRLLGKSENAVQTALVREYNNGLLQRKKITGIQKAGNVEFVYSLSTQKGTFSEHTLRVNDALITMVLAAKQEQSIRLVQLQHERYFKQHSIQVDNKQFLEPDAFLQFQLTPPFGGENESMGFCLEIDLGSEVWAQWQEKVDKYLKFASGVYQKQFDLRSLTIAVCCPGGNTQLLRKWTKQALELRNKKEYAELFVFTDRNPVDCDPVEWLTAPVWTDIDNTPYALIEKINPVSVKKEEEIRQPQAGIFHLVKEDEPIQQVPDVSQPQDHPLRDTPVAPLIALGQNQQWRIYTNYKRYQDGIVQKPPDDRTRLEQIESLSETLQQMIRQGIPKSLDLQGAIIDYLCIREHQEALHLPATPVPVILIPYFQNIYYQELQVIVNRLAVFPSPAAPSSVQPVPTNEAQLELSPAELQKRYKEYEDDMIKMRRKPLAYEAWEKLELAKYAAENE